MKTLPRSSRQSRALLNSLMKNFRKRLTPRSVVLIIAIIAIIYFLFQLSTFQAINNENREHIRASVHSRKPPKDIRKKVKRTENEEDIKDRPHNERRATEELAKTKLKYSHKKQTAVKNNVNKSSPVRREQKELKDKESRMKEEILRVKHIRPKDMPLGVDPELVRHYMKNSKSKFTCIKSKEIIQFNRVNDDYCDCSDGSDEPGTSACANTSFYCDYQLKDSAHFVPSSRVNDGICDCCDGSDEYKNITVVNTFRLHGNKRKYRVSHAPCEDLCKDKEQEKIKLLKIQLKGIQLKKEYLEEAKKYPSQNNKKYGPGGIFYKLSLKCYEWKSPEYDYAVCPFKHVKQQKFPRPETDLGHFSEWLSARPGNYQLKMTGGDAHLCPDVGRRQTLITFHCGFEDKVLNLHEDERCKYVVDFVTPAAC